MYAIAVTLVLLVCTVGVSVAGDPNINPVQTDTGESEYATPLYCSYPTLLMATPYQYSRKSYTQIEDKKCCYLENSRHKCCLDKSSKDASQACRCDPSVSCSVTTTTSTTTTTTTTAPTTTTTTTTTVPTTTTRTTVPTTRPTTTSTTTRPTTTSTTTRPTTTSTTTRPTTTSTTTRPTTTSTTTRPTTTSTTTRPTTTSTTTRPTTTSTTTVPTTTSTTTVPTTTSTTTVPTTTSTTTVPTTTTTRPTTTTTRPTTTTTRPTTTRPTTTRPTTTTTRPTTTTTRPTTTTTRPTTTTTRPTTTRPTTTTSTTTTTTPPKPLCPSTYRVLNGEKAPSNCLNSGIFNITFPDGSVSSCNGVYTHATVNDVYKETILTAEFCMLMIEQGTTEEDAFLINIGSQTYKLLPPTFTVMSGPPGTAFIDVPQNSGILDEVGACQENKRCPYNKNTMQGRVDLTQCTIYSYGHSNAVDYTQDGLNQVALAVTDGGCTDLDPPVPESLCFKTTSGKTLTCGGDHGAPIYCKALGTPEEILMGVTPMQTQCDESPYVSALPHPA